MSNRILLDGSRLLVSQPGIDVLTAAETELLFNSDASQLSLHMAGTLSLGFNNTTNVNFGKTFVNRPVVLILNRNSFSADSGQMFMNSAFIYDPTQFSIAIAFKTTNTSFQLYQGLGGTYRISYQVWDFDL